MRKPGQVIKKQERRTSLKSEAICQFNISINIFEDLNHKEFMPVYVNHFAVVLLRVRSTLLIDTQVMVYKPFYCLKD